ncbi:MAG TPA: response regulator, partial [Ferruginibacter sp.]|nr:response regulator [Ferruginibacter sp.]
NVYDPQLTPGTAELASQAAKPFLSSKTTSRCGATWARCSTNEVIVACALRRARRFSRMSQSEPRDLVLSDISMPGMSGLELLREIKSKFENPPPIVMMITAYGDPENYNQAMKLGADDFLTKPIDFSLLKEKLKALY